MNRAHVSQVYQLLAICAKTLQSMAKTGQHWTPVIQKHRFYNTSQPHTEPWRVNQPGVAGFRVRHPYSGHQ